MCVASEARLFTQGCQLHGLASFWGHLLSQPKQPWTAGLEGCLWGRGFCWAQVRGLWDSGAGRWDQDREREQSWSLRGSLEASKV